MTLGQKIADLRKKLKLSQNELGKKVSTSGDIIGRYERDEVKPSIEVASKIADELNVSLDYLMGKTEFELDKSIIKRVIEIQSLPDEDKSHILYTLDGLLQNVRTKMAFAKWNPVTAMNVDNDFSIKQFLLSNGFEQTRDSDKRDNFKKTYFDPWEQKDKEILVTLYYQHGTNCFTEYIGGVMQVYSKVDLSSDSTTPNYVNIYNGLWPNNFDFALSLFRHILPGQKEFQDLENNITCTN